MLLSLLAIDSGYHHPGGMGIYLKLHRDISTGGKYVIIAGSKAGALIVDVNNPSNPTLTTIIPPDTNEFGAGAQVSDIHIVGRWLIMAIENWKWI